MTTPMLGAAACGGLLAVTALLADAEASGWAQAFGQAVLGAGAFGSAWINLQMGRDRLRFDADRVKLEAKVQQLEAAREYDARVISDQRAEIDGLRAAVHRIGNQTRKADSKAVKVAQVIESHHPEDAPILTGSDSHQPLPPDGVERRNPDPTS